MTKACQEIIRLCYVDVVRETCEGCEAVQSDTEYMENKKKTVQRRYTNTGNTSYDKKSKGKKVTINKLAYHECK